jgi:hypothetical protein
MQFGLSQKVASFVFGVAVLVGPAQGALTITTGPQTSEIPGLTGFATTGAMMDGLAVTVEFTNGFSETLIWADTGVNSGGVLNANGWWGLSLSGDTFATPWQFTISPNANLGQLSRLFLDATGALTVFDRNFPGPGDVGVGTPGSANGNDFNCSAASADVCNDNDARAEYDFQVNLAGEVAVGDLWQTLDVKFFDPVTEDPAGPRTNWSFVQDTDNDSRLFQTPEPGSLALLGLALGAAGLLRRRRTG